MPRPFNDSHDCNWHEDEPEIDEKVRLAMEALRKAGRIKPTDEEQLRRDCEEIEAYYNRRDFLQAHRHLLDDQNDEPRS